MSGWQPSARRATLAAVLALLTPSAPAAALAQDEAPPRRYGDAGSSEVNLLLGVSSDGLAVGAGFRHFVIDGVAPGLEASFYRADGLNQGYTFASLRVTPLRFDQFAIVLTGRAGRVFLSDHSDGWAYGGDAGLLLFLSRHVGVELGYEILRLAPDSFCADLTECTLQRPVLGLRITF